ncbi:GNAT family N-acetyltransferase [Aestuariimicrobium soli]|uniref:GNAT family N-acetyltransferase n=1 Tax=Aestuariimicrobium soli TaxID=2035834 RepID=UPI003EBF326D
MLRAAVVADAPQIAELHRLGWEAYRGLVDDRVLAETPESSDACLARWTSQLQPGRATRVLVDDEAGMLRGFISCGPTADPDLSGKVGADEVWDLWVHPDHRRAGVGAALLTQVLRESRRPLVVWVLNENTDGIRFYQREGARWDGLMRTEVVNGVELTLLRLLWK